VLGKFLVQINPFAEDAGRDIVGRACLFEEVEGFVLEIKE